MPTPRTAVRTLARAAILLASAHAVAAVPTTAPTTAPAKPYLGTFVYRYGAFVVRAEVPDKTRLKWTVLAGLPGRPSGDETVQRHAVRPDVFLVTWVEASGAAVTQVSDFTAMIAVSTIVQDGRSTIYVGTI